MFTGELPEGELPKGVSTTSGPMLVSGVPGASKQSRTYQLPWLP